MVQQAFALLFVVTLVGLVSAMAAGVVIIAWPRKKMARPIASPTEIHAHP